MGMTRIQVDYALDRLNDAFDEIMGDRPDNDDRKSYRENAELFRSGKLKLTPVLVTRALRKFDEAVIADARWHNGISDYLQTEIKMAISNARPKVSQAQREQDLWNKRSKKLRVKFVEAKDQLILGDAEKALKLIEAFRKTKI